MRFIRIFALVSAALALALVALGPLMAHHARVSARGLSACMRVCPGSKRVHNFIVGAEWLGTRNGMVSCVCSKTVTVHE